MPFPLHRHLARATLLLALVLSIGLIGTTMPANSANGAEPSTPPLHQQAIEDYAEWQPGDKCSPRAKKGMRMFAAWTVGEWGGGSGNISRSCGSSSEHTEGRAWDWPANANRRSDRRTVRKFMGELFKADDVGNEHANARRMGIMYVIWNDKIYSAWNQFEPEPYLSSSCKKKSKCSKSLRHRDHVHVSITRKAGRGKTSWYTNQLN